MSQLIPATKIKLNEETSPEALKLISMTKRKDLKHSLKIVSSTKKVFTSAAKAYGEASPWMLK